MRAWLRRGAVLGVVVVAGLILSCDGNGTDVEQGGQISVAVTGDGDGLSWVEVELYAEGGGTVLDSERTSATGAAGFSGLDAGTYEVEITVPTGYVMEADGPTRQTVMVSGGETGSASFSLVSPGEVVEVHLTSSFTFTPADLTIEPGTTVAWINDEAIFHTITPDGHSEWTRREVSAEAETFRHTFETEGEFPYICEPHESQGMTGTITVEAP